MKPDDASFFLRKRNYCACCVMISTVLSIWLKTNLSIALVNLTTSKNATLDNSTFVEEAEFEWTPFEKDLILSVLFCGFIFAPIGGVLATRLGAGVKIYTLGMMATGLLNALSPFLMKYDYFAYLGERLLEGLFEGMATASIGEVFIHWTHPSERTFLTNLGTTGLPLGYIITYPVAGYLNQHYTWETTFYITGGALVVWSFIFLLTVADHPTKDRFMKKVERNYFKQMHKISLEDEIVHPWWEMLKSKPLWALLNEKFVEAWSTSFLGLCIPLYFQDTYSVNTEQIAWMSSIPHYFSILGKIPAARLADYLSNNKIYTKTKIYKFYIIFAQISAIAFLIMAGMTNHFQWSVIIFGCFQFCFSLAFVSSDVLPMDISGRHSGVVLGMCTTISSIGFILNPITIGILVKNHTFAEWSKYFLFMCLLNAWTAVIFLIYGSGETQPWAKTEKEKPETLLQELPMEHAKIQIVPSIGVTTKN